MDSAEPDIYDKLVQQIAQEAVRIHETGNFPNIGLGGLSGAVMSTLIFSWADNFGPEAETVIDQVATTAKETIREKRAVEAASIN